MVVVVMMVFTVLSMLAVTLFGSGIGQQVRVNLVALVANGRIST
jgi:hypothetical protein